MQSEDSTTTTDELDNMHYGAQSQGSGVLDPSSIEEGEFEAAMAGDHDAHGLKRPTESDDDGDADSSMLVEERPKKKTRGRVKIEMKFIANKLRRYTTFSKRKTGIMKKVRAHLSQLVCELNISLVNFNVKRMLSCKIYPIILFYFFFKGLRTKHPDRNAGDAVGSFRNRACLHLRHKKTSTHDYFRERQSSHSNVLELSRSSCFSDSEPRPKDVSDGIRRNRSNLHRERK